jgi:hypothetical protein
MINQSSSDRIKADCRLINQTAIKLGAPRLFLRAVVIIVALVVWFLVAAWLLRFGQGINYTDFTLGGQQVIDILTRINPYLWWAVIAIWTLIVYFVVRAWVDSSIQASRAASVPTPILADLCSNLSGETVEVLLWCWGNREEPFTQGDLRRARTEVRYGRIDKIAVVRQQEAIMLAEIEGADLPAQRQSATSPVRARRPAGVAAVPSAPDSDRIDVEPTLGSAPRRDRV